MLGHKLKGLSLIELLIGVLISAIVVAGGIKIFADSSRGSTENIKVNQLNQDLRRMMDLMVSDIRRAGYSSAIPPISALAEINIEDISINSNVHQKSCIGFKYGRGNGFFGYKLALDTSYSPDKIVLRMRKEGGPSLACNDWSGEAINSAEVEVINLRFDVAEEQLNIQWRLDNPSNPVPNPPHPTLDCHGTDKCLVIRIITISLTGALKDGTSQTLTENVRIRNDQFCQTGLKSPTPPHPLSCNEWP